MDWQCIYTQVALTWQWIGIGLAALDWWPIGIGLATDKPRVSASAIVPNGCVHCTVLASIFLDWLNIANPKLNLDWHQDLCCIGKLSILLMSIDVGCMWDFHLVWCGMHVGFKKKVKTFIYRIPFCKCGMHVGFSFYFLVQKLWYVKVMPTVVVGRWRQSSGATVSRFFFRYIIQNET